MRETEMKYPIKKYPTVLNGVDSRFICIPESVIFHPNHKVLALFIYFAIRVGKDDCLELSISSLIDWFLYKPDGHKTGLNAQFREALQYFIDNKVFSCDVNVLKIPLKTVFTISNIKTMICKGFFDEEYFAKIYIDEILDIRDYYKNNPTNNFIDTLTTLAFLRLNILQRDNKDVEKKNAEAYFNYYKNIYTELNIGKKTFSRVINVLSNKLHIIYLVHSKYQYKKDQHEKGNVITLPTIFCNCYRREKNEVTNGGEEYCKEETKKAYKKMIKDFDIKKAINLKRDTSLEDADTDSDWIEGDVNNE